MKRIMFGMLAAGAMVVAPAAFAAPMITGVTVTGATSGFSWSTSGTGSTDTLFIAHGAGAGVSDVVNPTNNFTSVKFGKADQYGDYNFTLYGDGYGAVVTNKKGKITSAPNSDAAYDITVMLQDGTKTGSLTGLYTLAGNTFATTSTFAGKNGTYQLDVFDWGRQLNDYVGKHSTSTAGDTGASLADYRGDLSLTKTGAVPEPATWAMMLLGFGMIGVGLRYRRKSAKFSFA